MLFCFYTGILYVMVVGKLVIMSKQSGFSLVEVLIAWCIASTAIMMLLQHQHQALLQVRDAYFRSEAVAELSAILACVQHFPVLVRSTLWYGHCQRRVTQRLPSGHLSVHCDQRYCQGLIKWYCYGQQQYRLRVELQ